MPIEFKDIPSKTPADGDYLIGHNSSDVDYRYTYTSLLTNKDTDDLTEGSTNQYFTNERVDDRVAAFIQNGTGITWSHNDGANTLTPTVSLSAFTTANLAETSTARYMRQIVVNIPHGQILTLNAVPIELVPAAPDTINMLFAVYAHFDNPDTAAYTNSGIDIVDAATGNSLFSVGNSFLNSSSDKSAMFAQASSGVLVTPGTSIQVKATSSDPSGGGANNTIKVVALFTTYSVA